MPERKTRDAGREREREGEKGHKRRARRRQGRPYIGHRSKRRDRWRAKKMKMGSTTNPRMVFDDGFPMSPSSSTLAIINVVSSMERGTHRRRTEADDPDAFLTHLPLCPPALDPSSIGPLAQARPASSLLRTSTTLAKRSTTNSRWMSELFNSHHRPPIPRHPLPHIHCHHLLLQCCLLQGRHRFSFAIKLDVGLVSLVETLCVRAELELCKCRWEKSSSSIASASSPIKWSSNTTISPMCYRHSSLLQFSVLDGPWQLCENRNGF